MTAKFSFIVHVEVQADSVGEAIDSLKEAVQDCRNAVEFTIATPPTTHFPLGLIVAAHSDYVVPTSA